LYSLTGPDNSVHAFKFFDVDYDQFFETDIPSLDLILTDIKKLVKQFKIYYEDDLDCMFEFTCIDGSDLGADENLCQFLRISNTKFESHVVGGEPFIIRNLTYETVLQRVDPSIAKYQVQLNPEDYRKIKSLIQLYSEPDAMSIEIKKGKIKFKDKKWSLKIGEVEQEDETLIFKKKYLKNIEESENIIFDVFDTFIVFRGINNHLMITLEISEY
jgi:hypothetical protein